MFSLGIIDKLTPGDLTGGAFVAGTGTIDVDGEVGPIGGIPQKMIGARDAGATLSSSPRPRTAPRPSAPCPTGCGWSRSRTLDDARRARSSDPAGRPGLDALPACTADVGDGRHRPSQGQSVRLAASASASAGTRSGPRSTEASSSWRASAAPQARRPSRSTATMRRTSSPLRVRGQPAQRLLLVGGHAPRRRAAARGARRRPRCPATSAGQAIWASELLQRSVLGQVLLLDRRERVGAPRRRGPPLGQPAARGRSSSPVGTRA